MRETAVEKIEIMPQNISGEEGDTIQLSITFTPSNATVPVTWSSSNTDVAKIDENGQLVFTGRKNVGATTTITATTADGKSATSTATVSGECYDLWIAGLQVTSANKEGLIEDVVELDEEAIEYFFEKGGKISFDGFDLTLENVMVPAVADWGIGSLIDGLTINLLGENIVNGKNVGLELAKSTTITGDGTLSTKGSLKGIDFISQTEGDALNIRNTTVTATGSLGIAGDASKSLMLNIENATVIADGYQYGIYNMNGGINLSGCDVVEPASYKIENGHVNDLAGGNIASYVKIAPVEETPHIKGDVNEDGKVDINDVVAVINQMAGAAHWTYANVNEDPDSNIDINDVVAVINIMAGK